MSDGLSQFQNPRNPCQIPNCPYCVHIFPFHPDNDRELRLGAELQNTPLGAAIVPALKTIKVLALSHWCMRHTIEQGFCWRCGTPNGLVSKQLGVCAACCTSMENEIMLAGYFGHLTPQDITDEFLSKMPLVRVAIRDNDDTPPHKKRLHARVFIPKKN